ncbi:MULTISPECIES: helix-turn-helix domain-containing protein [unclassified Bradyrhizobium]|uniref:helix-turn-helix domain-containing protein n=1 Tax=unclassified Bradyrhizobium TaxID=2631580 RepID=UPI0020A06B80|nr:MULTISPECIES: helix-turn-helix domain-containing protein [unclassified Bradyrhizobium]
MPRGVQPSTRKPRTSRQRAHERGEEKPFVSRQIAPLAPEQVEPLAYTIDEACLIARVGRNSLYKAADSGALRARKLGKKTLILREDLQRWLGELPRYEPKRA